MLDLHEHVGELELNCLEPGDRLTELVPALGVGVGLVVGPPRETDRERRNRDPPAVEDRQELLEAVAADSE